MENRYHFRYEKCWGISTLRSMHAERPNAVSSVSLGRIGVGCWLKMPVKHGKGQSADVKMEK